MNGDFDKTITDVFQELITSVQIRSVQFIDIQSQRASVNFALEDANLETKISWKQLFPIDDPVQIDDTQLVFRPKYEFIVTRDGSSFFNATMVVALQFSIENKESFKRCWENVEAQKIFREKQIMRTMWPILRQQLMDCMSRHSLLPITLPWIM